MEEIKNELIPWQRRQELGFFRALLETIKQILFNPKKFFDTLEIKNSIAEPFYFFSLIMLPVLAISTIFDLIAKNNLFSEKVVSITLVAFLFVAIGIFIASAILHLFVLLLGGKGGFKGTFNILAYCTATSIFSIIPFIGGLISSIWGIIVIVIGYKRIHNFSTLRAICAYLAFPFFIVIIALLAAIAIPNFMMAKRNANEAFAKTSIRTISIALENYSAANNGEYPLSEDAIKKTNYSYEYYDKTIKNGYIYSLNLNQNDYVVMAKPYTCGTTGRKVFIIQKSGSLLEKDCK